ncbi:glycosyltransferase [Polynucleobacter sp. MWH-Loch1C5]|uniref:glycosyltransferase n=1 Tax=Polynucleobacter sp. MWH-Loch1C5 TaxID=2689108 RepID=UPI001C0D7E0C|nr:glycosyltransferase [Polynucleobacter sp. MWH-Loch1C5]MBU3542211.1 glycosyltransferase [Polynucleobacter sp. MWH-Loch1C5]
MPTKIAIVLPNLSIIGAQRVAIDYGSELAQRGYKVTFLIKEKLSDLSLPVFQEAVVFDSTIFCKIKFVRYIESAIKLLRILRARKFDCVISVTPNYNRLLGLFKLLKIMPSRLVIEDHACPPDSYDDEFGKGLKRKWYELSEIFYRSADTMRVLSDESETYYKSRHPNVHIIVQPNMMDLVRIKNASLNVPKYQPVKPFIFYVGRLVRQKDVQFLITAFNEASEYIPHDLIIVGYGPLKSKLVEQAKLTAASNRIHFLENSDSNYWYMKEAALFPMTSIWEGQGLTIIEAMVLGTPVVSLDFNAGPKYLIGDNERGIIVKERSPSVFAKELIELINNPDKAFSLASAASRFVSDEIDIKRNFHKYINSFLIRNTELINNENNKSNCRR